MAEFPGSRSRPEITRVARKYIAARVVRVLEPSADRIAPPCPYFGDCTGCQWQHVSYDRQLAIKKELVADALSRVGNFSAPPVSEALAAPQQYSYRNHARFTVREGGLLGYVNSQSRRFVRIDHCMLMHQGINHLLTQLQGKCAETSQLSIRAGKDTGDFLVQPRLANSEIQPPTGQKHYCDSVAGRRFKVASPSFFQVNVDQAAQLVQVVRQSLELNGTELLLDAYAGVGSFAILLAPHVRQVIAVEESAAAVADARENAAGLGNITFILGKAEEVLKSVRDRPDVAVLDPPRAGCHPQALDHLIQLAPRRIVYVACDAETMARDLKILCSSHYQLERVQPVDMFPQTYHVESVASLTRRQGPDLITLASASPRRRELLNELGLEFQVLPSHAPEEALTGESPQQLVERLSLAKASAVAPGNKAGLRYGRRQRGGP